MFSRLSREFGGPFFCARVWFLFFGILFILWVLLSGNCRTISTLSGCCVLGWLNVLGLVDSEAMGRFRLLNLCFFGGCGWCGEGTLACLCFMSRDQSYACSCFLWIAFDSLDLWPGSTLLDDLSWHLDFVYFLVPSPFFNGFWAILWAFLWESKSGAFSPCTLWGKAWRTKNFAFVVWCHSFELLFSISSLLVHALCLYFEL